ncbi:MAG: hypothetical protein P8M73_13035 [Luminiphilus sp.]|nr:hypothetical protein [Luminiphilus sp.]
MVYHADRYDTAYDEGMTYLSQSARAGHTQAMFVYGLMLSRESRRCEAGPWMRRAAEAGLKSARIAYVDHAVAGYYENLLLGALQRELEMLRASQFR